MVTKSSLSKKLVSYSAIAAAVLAVDRKADAQIVYTKLNPYDTVGYAYNSYQLDLNNDGIIDFNFNGGRWSVKHHWSGISSSDPGYTTTYFTDTNIRCKVYNSNKVLLNSTYSNIFSGLMIKPLNAGDVISSKGTNWGNGSRSLANIRSGGLFTNNWNGKEHYVGLELLKNGNTYYGWARVYVAKDMQYGLIEEYGYNATADSPVYAGQECEIEYPTPVIQQSGDTLTTSAPMQIQWYFNNKPIPGDTLNSITATLYGIYSVTAGDTTICHGTSLPFNYLNCNTLHPYITSPSDLICNQNYPTIQLDTLPPDYSVEWFINDTLIKGVSISNISTEYANNFYTFNYKFSALVSEPGGCSFATNTIYITADTNSLYPEIIQSNDSLFATRGSGLIPSNSVFQWYQIGDSVIAGANRNYYVPPDTGLYFLTVTDSLGCSGAYSFDYQVCQDLHFSISAATNIICPNTGVYLQFLSPPPLNYTENWFLNGSFSGYEGVTLEAPGAGNYYAVVYEQGGCYDTTKTINLFTDTIKVSAAVEQHGDSLIVESGTKRKLQTSLTFQWFDSNNDSITGASNSYLLPNTNGYYYVTITDSLGCDMTLTGYYSVTTNLKPLTSTANIHLSEYNNLLNIKFNNEPYDGYQLSIYNSIGQKVFSSAINSDHTIVNLGTFVKGLYLVSVEKDNTRIVKKIILD